MTVLAAYLSGKETVRECMDDPLFLSFVERGIEDEILPTLKLARSELIPFAEAVLERFHNPFVRHYLLAIALNSVSKYKARILGTVVDYVRDRGKLPPRLTFALAALIVFYRGRELDGSALIGERNGAPYRIQDDPSALAFFRDAWIGDEASPDFHANLVRSVLARKDFWGDDLNLTLAGFADKVTEYVRAIRNDGMRRALEKVSA
jgi:tagaturonate reductase